MDNLVSTDWLGDHLYADDIMILDASWHLPAAKRDARAEFLSCRIPGAQFFDIDDISDKSTTLPHMLPSAHVFAEKVGALGAGDGKRIVCYDSVGLFSAARCWWMFKVFCHKNVAVLDGGLKKWIAEERTTGDGPPAMKPPAHFTATLNASMVCSIDQLAGSQIADARSPTRFRGEEPEPRPGVKPGHIPGAKNVHYASLLNADGILKSAEDLAAVFSKAGINRSDHIVTSCGSGVTAAILTLALEQIGARNHALYDGSWTEWGASGREIEVGSE
jgi:thiosulfate/3-mercaptopyruvate sulfurtransferase